MKKRNILKWLGLLTILFLLTACNDPEIPNAKNYDIEDFTYTNQDNKEVSKEDLMGSVWVANFIFTSCADVCLPMTSNMAKLQQMVNDEGLEDVRFVSFSVDPKVDKPDVIKNYASHFNADFANWDFLTGYKQNVIEEFAVKNFKMYVKKPDGESQVIHDTKFVLVNKEGKITQYYSGLEDIPYDEIIKHIKILQK